MQCECGFLYQLFRFNHDNSYDNSKYDECNQNNTKLFTPSTTLKNVRKVLDNGRENYKENKSKKVEPKPYQNNLQLELTI